MKTYEEILKETRKEFDMLDNWNIGSETTDEKFHERVSKKYAFEVAQKALEDVKSRLLESGLNNDFDVMDAFANTPLIIE